MMDASAGPASQAASPASPVIRTVQLWELEAVHAIERVCFRNPWPLNIFQQELTHEWSRLWGIYPDGGEALAGYLLFWRVYDEIHILNIAVHPDFRGRRLARTLMDKLERETCQAGARCMTLEVRPSNAAALELYIRTGFRKVAVRPRYYTDNGEDAFVMVKDLP